MTTPLPEHAHSVPVAIWRNPRNGGRSIHVGEFVSISPATARELAHALIAAADKAEAEGRRESEQRLR